MRHRCLITVAVLFLFVAPLFATQSPYVGGPYPFAGTIQAENYDNGDPGESYHDTSNGNVFGIYRFDNVDVGQIVPGEYHIGNLDTSQAEWTEYTVNVPSSGTYNMTFRYTSAYTASTTSFRVYLGTSSTALTAITPSITVSPNGSWTAYTVPAAVTATVPDGLQGNSRILRIVFERGAFNLDWIRFQQSNPTCTAATISSPSNRTANVGGTVTWSLTTGGSPAPTVQWYHDGKPLANEGDCPESGRVCGATTRSVTIKSVNHNRDGGPYYAVATNGCGTAAQSATATVTVTCDTNSPNELHENIATALKNERDYCVGWLDAVRPGFAATFPASGSYNLPVIANAAAFIKYPNGAPGYTAWNMENFWISYLSGELGDRDQPDYIGPNAGSPWYYGGKEIFSGDYQRFNLGAVLAVHYQAQKTGKDRVAGLARRWLRATLTLLATSAMQSRPTILHANDQIFNTTDPWTGPYAAVAGERTPWGFWTESHRNIILGKALNFAASGGEVPALKNVRIASENAWLALPLSSRPTNVYGLTAAEVDALRAVILSSTLPPDLVSNYLGPNLRTYVNYQILAWDNVRATLLETSDNNLTAPTYGVVSYGQHAYFVYPWPGVFTDDRSIFRNVCVGKAGLDFNADQMSGSHPQCDSNIPPRLPAQYAAQLFPSTAWKYWITLRTSGGPVIH